MVPLHCTHYVVLCGLAALRTEEINWDAVQPKESSSPSYVVSLASSHSYVASLESSHSYVSGLASSHSCVAGLAMWCKHLCTLWPDSKHLSLDGRKIQLTVQLTCPWLWQKRRHGLNREALSIAALSVATASAVQMVHIATAPATEWKEQNNSPGYWTERTKRGLLTTL